ncbi:MAG: protein lplB [Paenibacillus sp.]|nr:protein lplB [Paenibacillus sp.]
MSNKWRRQLPLIIMLLPAVIIVLIYQYGPMFGLVIAFQKFTPVRGFFKSPFVGWDNFIYVFSLPDFGRILYNTVFIAIMKIIAGLVVPITFAVLLNELIHEKFKRTVQTLVYLPHFLSWVLLGGILIDILSPSQGIVNHLIQWLGFKPVFFLGNNGWFPYVIVGSDIWKDFGFSTIVYLAAITGINPTLYEAAVMDGAGRLRQTWHITLPGMAPVIVLLATLSLGQILNAGFDQIFNLYSPITYESGDIIDTRVYRLAFEDRQYSVATAVGLFKSVISFLLISSSYYLAHRFANYRIF